MNRRSFNATLAGLAAGVSVPYLLGTNEDGPPVILKAEFTTHFPEALTIFLPFSARIRELRDFVFELRTYRSSSTTLGNCLDGMFPRARIHPVQRGNLTYLIPFETLSAREQAWNIFNADPEWNRVRDQVDSYQFGLYRLAA